MNPRGKFALPMVMLLLLSVLSACAPSTKDALPLQDYTDPEKRFTFAIPEGWQSESGPDTLTLTPADTSAQPEDLRVILFTTPTLTSDVQQHLDLTNAALEPFLSSYLDADYQLVNQGEAKVSKFPAVILDFAKPWNGSYLLARLELVALPSQALAFLGTGSEANWEPFLPTFRAMLNRFQWTDTPSTADIPLP